MSSRFFGFLRPFLSSHYVSKRFMCHRAPSFKLLASTVGSKLRVQFQNGQVHDFHGIWLRDHCHCPKCVHPMTRQRLVDTSKIPLDIKPSSMTISPDGQFITVEWPENHSSQYSVQWLQERTKFQPKVHSRQNVHYLWGSELKEQLPTTSYEEVMQSNEGLKKWLMNIQQYGIGFVDGVPVNPKDTEALSKRIAFIRETHYGGFWDFTADLEHGDMAYTNMALSAHTDSTYFTDPVGLQIFHLLEHRGTGGTSLYVDGFNAASQLLQKSPSAYDTLSTFRIPAHCAGDDNTFIRPTPSGTYTILNHDPETNQLYQIRYNNDDRSTLSHAHPEKVHDFYKALKEWNLILKDPKNEVWTQLTPGRVVAIDNWRVLHGRSSFTGYRRLCGCYINWDDYISRVQTICHSRDALKDI